MDMSIYESMLRVLNATSVEQLKEQTQQVIEMLGFKHYMYLLSQQDDMQQDNFRLFSVATYPDAWLNRYLEMDYHLVDPTARHIREHHYPLPWSNATFSEAKARKMYEEAKQFGISAGVTCPIVTQQKDLAGFGYSKPGDADKLFEESVKSLACGHLLGCYMHEAVIRLLNIKPKPHHAELSPREIQCLNLSAQGFADAEIAWRLDVNTRTIRFHLKNVRQKLGANTRLQMISRAIELNIIGL
ncbi:LuxR family transcriptional regulator [Giesbergeria sinuosa]|uniref:LuxR family transcriptional regulator n=1 Tax=Giesbergeria sinuosa TaxID=80883 RepID=A0ABV9QGD0_9BURK